MENNKETTSTEQVDNSQQDNAIASAKARVAKKYEADIAENYIAKDKYTSLEEENKSLKDKINSLTMEINKPIVENKLLKSGMRKEAISDFLKYHPEVYGKSDADLENIVAETKKSSAYMFSSPGVQVTALPNSTNINVEDKQKPMYTLDNDGFVIKNK